MQKILKIFIVGFRMFAQYGVCAGTGSSRKQVVKMDIVNGSVVSVVG